MLISIITINYNNKAGLQRTIESIISQNYVDVEYIIIDGGSTDGSVDVIKQYEDKITYWVSEKDAGIYNAQNKGIEKATGEYLLFLNSGDEFVSSNVLKDSSVFLNDGVDFVTGDMKVIQEGKPDWVYSAPKSVDFEHFYAGIIPHPATFIKKSCFDRFGKYDENLKIVSDWKFFVVAICRYNCSYKKINLLISKFYMDGISTVNKALDLEERKMVLQSEFPGFYHTYVNYAAYNTLLNTRRGRYLAQIDKYPFSRKILTAIMYAFTKIKI